MVDFRDERLTRKQHIRQISSDTTQLSKLKSLLTRSALGQKERIFRQAFSTLAISFSFHFLGSSLGRSLWSTSGESPYGRPLNMTVIFTATLWDFRLWAFIRVGSSATFWAALKFWRTLNTEPFSLGLFQTTSKPCTKRCSALCLR